MRAQRIVVVGLVGLLAVVAACVGDEAPVNNNVTVNGDGGGELEDGPSTSNESGSGGVDDATHDAPPADAPADVVVDDAGTFAGVSGIAFWFEGDTNVAMAGANVASWTSRAGEPIVLTPQGGTVSLAAAAINGHAGIHLDGKPGNEACPCPGLVSATGVKLPMQPFTLFAVVRSSRWTDNTYNYEGSILASAPNPKVRLSQRIFAGPAPGFGIQAGSVIERAGFLDAEFKQPHLIAAVFAGSASQLRFDGRAETTTPGSVGSSELGDQIVVGHDGRSIGSFQGDIADLLVFGRALTTGEQTTVETALKSKYALP